METREYHCRQLLEDAKDFYLEEVHQPMQPRHRSLLKEGMEHAMLDYSKQEYWENSIFCRAAHIGYCWAQAAPKDNKFGYKALASSIRLFLSKEGAKLPDSEKGSFFKSVEDVIKNSSLEPLKVFMNLQKSIAYHWICAEGNHRQDFEEKLCHCIPAEGKTRIAEVRGPRRQPKKAKHRPLRSS